jgi:DNA repair protein RadD
MIELPSLFPHQGEFRDQLRSALARHGRVIACAQAGFGKTRVSKAIFGASTNREHLPNQTGRSLFVVFSRGLVDNASDSFSETPALPHAVIMSGRETAYGRRVQVASIDSLLSWFIEDGHYADTDITFDLIVFDEADSHHSKFARFLQHHDARRAQLGLHPAYVVGLTATPEAKGLSDVYKEIVLGPATSWLIENGFLVPFRYFRATQGKLGLLVKRGNSFTETSEAAAMEGLSGELLRDWQKFASDRVTIGFFPRRSHAQEAMTTFSEAGVRCEYVDGETSDDDRRRIFRALGNSVQYLCNVRVVGRGTDIPRADCVQLCVATASVAAFRQYVGRVSRTHPDKKDAVVIDHGGCVSRCGFFEDDPKWSLDISSKTPGEHKTRPSIECPKCQAIYRGGKCRNCGYEPSSEERKGQGLEFDGTELVEVKEKKQPKVKSAEALMISALYICGKSGRTWRQCCGIFNSLCKKQGSSYRIPSAVNVAGKRYQMPRFGSSDSGRKVGTIFPFTTQAGNHGGDYLETPQARQEQAF